MSYLSFNEGIFSAIKNAIGIKDKSGVNEVYQKIVNNSAISKNDWGD
jgi:hypothetical protein